MNMNGYGETNMGNRRTAAEVINQALLAEGMTQDEIEQDRHLADLFDDLLAAGQTVEEINADWKNKTPHEILREYAATSPLAVSPR